MRIRIDLAYDGTNFHGWAKQPTLRTVQGELQHALEKLLRIQSGDQFLQIVVAGRTDTGVHANHQVCHVDVDEVSLQRCVGYMQTDAIHALEYRLRRVLPSDIAVHSVSEAPEGFDARFSALDRTYVYRICDDERSYDPRLRNCILRIRQKLDIKLMNEAAGLIIGLHDFGSFAIPNPNGTTIREVKTAYWERIDNRTLLSETAKKTQIAYNPDTVESGLLCFTIVADAFAHNMVRSLVNACVQIGMHKKTLDWFEEKMQHPLREGSTGPIDACGLTLEHVEYPQDDLLASRADLVRAKRSLD
ncbi:MAG: tRNA pseudouridine(38-40) synthase TruA [Bifidobacteriaceae bacterium]|nr:tRNA pseudouridine(38-40) synthase TruA [Bifidobacteriaceae bacterium]